MHAERRRRLIAASGLMLAGLVLLPVWAPIAVVLTCVAVHVAQPCLTLLNVWWTRAHFQVLVLAHAATVSVASGSIVLGVAATLLLIPTSLFTRTLVERSGYLSLWIGPVGMVVGLAVVVAAWRFDLGGLAILPSVVVGARITHMCWSALRRLHANRRERWAVGIGDAAPEFRLRSQDGKREFKLSDERGHFVLLFFMRSDWCPVCHVQMRIYQKESETLSRHGVKVVAISSGRSDDSMELRDILGVKFESLVDEGCKVAARFGAIRSNVPDDQQAALPASFLIDPEGRVRYSTRADRVGEFAAPARLIEVLEQLAGRPAQAARA
ncbi:MAG: redoxin domain-containing protein [Deltaproteobacteria bacterium]|nr:redoxin domain-containing protein [Deltaproteobacteria bacterium]